MIKMEVGTIPLIGRLMIDGSKWNRTQSLFIYLTSNFLPLTMLMPF